ncbi:MAG: hypothetical protein HY320_03520 [Armatimonadetes bacterium]|nr:hypothetical protein [Armatimonadota bacterium]
MTIAAPPAIIDVAREGPFIVGVHPLRPHLAVWRLALALLALAASPGRAARLESPHFLIEYDARRVSSAEAGEASVLAERAWQLCRERLGDDPAPCARLLLTPDFRGATGFAFPARSNERGALPVVGVRWTDLEYVGLSGDYVLTHEVAHLFSGALAGSPLGEGIADWAAGSFAGVPLRPWWGPVLRANGLWVDPEGLFITGDYPFSGELDARTRTARYSEAALLVQYLIDTCGRERFAQFVARYAPARKKLVSNAELRGAAPVTVALQEDDPLAQPTRPAMKHVSPPDPAQVRQAFRETLGVEAEVLLARWDTWLRREPVPDPRLAERLVLVQQTYGAIRNYEMWALRQRPAPGAEADNEVRSAFVVANRARDRGDFTEARRWLGEALSRIDHLKRPQRIAISGHRSSWFAHPLDSLPLGALTVREANVTLAAGRQGCATDIGPGALGVEQGFPTPGARFPGYLGAPLRSSLPAL